MTGDRINPMVVKELRQGLKSRGFVSALILGQLLMVFCMLVYFLILAQSPGRAGDLLGADIFFQAILALCLLVIVPAQACFSLSNERSQKTLELIQLTRLQARNIVLGKNISLLLQSFLLYTAVMPFLVLRYFFGPMSVSGNIQIALGMVGLAVCLTGCGLWISSFTGKATRYTLIALMFLHMLVLGVFLMERLSYGSFSLTTLEVSLFALFALAYARFYLWEAISRIAPVVENHTFRKRLISLAMLLTILVIFWFDPKEEFLFFMLILLTPMCMATLCEPDHPLAVLHMRPQKLSALAHVFRMPGFVSASLFVSAIFLSVFLMGRLRVSPISHHHYSYSVFVFAPVLLNVLLFPIPLLQWRNVPSENRMLAYLIVQLACLILGLMAMFLQETFWFSGDGPKAFFPMWAFFDVIDMGGSYFQLFSSWFFTCVFLGIILARPGRFRTVSSNPVPPPVHQNAENTPPA
ncbi:MAG: hypothetical protein JJU29_02230 [Verrucomicrobia bacterium]|nr:hypothetical protein [Verrucomicrobiota bacterium]MCH8513363.1 hypothetical protein [Kiritimatiellia bacterium]